MSTPTAEEFLSNNENFNGFSLIETREFILEQMIQFAKLHLKAQEEAILNLVSMNINSGNVRYTSLEYSGKNGKEIITVDEKSIKGAYPLENVK